MIDLNVDEEAYLAIRLSDGHLNEFLETEWIDPVNCSSGRRMVLAEIDKDSPFAMPFRDKHYVGLFLAVINGNHCAVLFAHGNLYDCENAVTLEDGYVVTHMDTYELIKVELKEKIFL